MKKQIPIFAGIIVSADYQIKPVLAFIEKGNFKKGDAPGGAVMWLNKTIQNTEIVRKGLYDNTNLAKAAWSTYYTETKGKVLIIVGPILIPMLLLRPT